MPPPELEDPRVKLMRKWSKEMPEAARGGLRAGQGDDDDDDDDSRSVRSSYSASSYRSSASFLAAKKGKGWTSYVKHTNGPPNHDRPPRVQNQPNHAHAAPQHPQQPQQAQQAQGSRRRGKGKGKGKGNTPKGPKQTFVEVEGELVEITKENVAENKHRALKLLSKFIKTTRSALETHDWVKESPALANVKTFSANATPENYNAALEKINAFQKKFRTEHGSVDPNELVQTNYLQHLKKFASGDGKGTYESLRTSLNLEKAPFRVYLTSKLYGYLITVVTKAIYEKNAPIIKEELKTNSPKKVLENLLKKSEDKVLDANENAYFYLHSAIHYYDSARALFYSSESVEKKGTNTAKTQAWKANPFFQAAGGQSDDDSDA